MVLGHWRWGPSQALIYWSRSYAHVFYPLTPCPKFGIHGGQLYQVVVHLLAHVLGIGHVPLLQCCLPPIQRHAAFVNILRLMWVIQLLRLLEVNAAGGSIVGEDLHVLQQPWWSRPTVRWSWPLFAHLHSSHVCSCKQMVRCPADAPAACARPCTHFLALVWSMVVHACTLTQAMWASSR